MGRMRHSVLLFLAVAPVLHAQLETTLSPQTREHFNQYVAGHEPRIAAGGRQQRALPWMGDADLARVRKGELVIRAAAGDGTSDLPDGMVHDWIGGIFLPGTTVQKASTFLQNYAEHKRWYPEIVDSKLVSGNTSAAKGWWLLKRKKVITVVMRAELTSRFEQVSPQHGYIHSATDKIIEVAHYGKPEQKEYPAGKGHGFLWGFRAYWNLHEADGGVYAECRVISYSRDIPAGLGWIVRPFVKSMPRESLESTLSNTRRALSGK